MTILHQLFQKTREKNIAKLILQYDCDTKTIPKGDYKKRKPQNDILHEHRYKNP